MVDSVAGAVRLRGRGAAGRLDGGHAAGQLAVPAGGQPGAAVRARAGGRPGRARGVRSVYDSLRDAIDRRGLPDVLDPLTPTQVRDVPAPDPSLLRSPVVTSVQGSVVKVTGMAPSCSRQIDGSGFVYAPERVMTNAHVLAGVDRPGGARRAARRRRDAGLRRRGDRHRRAGRPGPARAAAVVRAAGRPTPAPTRSSWATRAAGRSSSARPGSATAARSADRTSATPHGRSATSTRSTGRPRRQLRRAADRAGRQRARRGLRLGDRRAEHRLRADRAEVAEGRDARARPAHRARSAPARCE